MKDPTLLPPTLPLRGDNLRKEFGKIMATRPAQSKEDIFGAFADKKPPNKSEEELLRGEEHFISLYNDGKIKRGAAITRPIVAPVTLSLDNNYQQTADFLSLMRFDTIAAYNSRSSDAARTKEAHRRLRLPVLYRYYDFEKIENISVSVALIIASEFTMMRRSGSLGSSAVNIERWKPNVRRLLSQIGFFSVTGVDASMTTITEGNGWRIVRFRTDDKTDGAIVGQFLDDLKINEISDKPEVYDGIVEALVNVKQHAYPGSFPFTMPHAKSWWLTGAVDFEERKVIINALDRGATIPYTLAANYFNRNPVKDGVAAQAVGLARSTYPYDAFILADAMRYGISSTGDRNRGKGLPAMQDVVDFCSAGSFKVYSRCGKYGKTKGEMPEIECGASPIDGTLISWNLSF